MHVARHPFSPCTIIDGVLFEPFSLCLVRACLGKMIIYTSYIIQKGPNNTSVLPRRLDVVNPNLVLQRKDCAKPHKTKVLVAEFSCAKYLMVCPDKLGTSITERSKNRTSCIVLSCLVLSCLVFRTGVDSRVDIAARSTEILRPLDTLSWLVCFRVESVVRVVHIQPFGLCLRNVTQSRLS